MNAIINNIKVKTKAEIELMRQSGRLLGQVFEVLDGVVSEGVSTLEINNFVESYITDTLQARPASKGQYGYKFVLNSSINDVVCHGIPSASQILRDGDIINIDITLEKNGYIADSSKMYAIGNVSLPAKQLIKTTYEAMWQGIHTVSPNAKTGDIGYAIQKYAEKRGYSVVREYCGHGIGRDMHEEPNILHYGRPNTGIKLREGMTFTIEPMINQGKRNIKTKKDGWTVVTKDKKLSAQWEHTVLVTRDGYEVLTLRSDEVEPNIQ